MRLYSSAALRAFALDPKRPLGGISTSFLAAELLAGRLPSDLPTNQQSNG